MALVKVINQSTVARGIEFLNDSGVADRATVMARSSITIEESRITTTDAELTKRGLKIIVLTEPTKAAQGNVAAAPQPQKIAAPAPQAEKKDDTLEDKK